MPKKASVPPAPDEPLTENEGSLLGVVARMQPMTTYQLLKIYAESPVSTFNSSKGGVYKTVRNLKLRGLIAVEPIKDDARNAEMLSTTARGLDMLRAWTRGLRPEHTLIMDPLRTRVLSLDLLSRDEKIAWVVDAKNLIREKLAEVEAYGAKVDVPFQDIVHMSSVGSLQEKILWLEKLLTMVVRDTRPEPD